MTTILPKQSDSAHWYTKDGQSCYSVPLADGSGVRSTTLRDARKLSLLPSVTTILRVTHKQALVDWLIEQACLSVLTAPRQPDEQLDAFVNRVLKTERQQDAEAAKARDLGTAIHADIEAHLSAGNVAFTSERDAYVLPVVELVLGLGRVVATEKIVVGEGYAGKTDCLVEGDSFAVLDFKTTKTIPARQSWDEHRLQLSAYAKAIGTTGDKPIRTANVYISTQKPGVCKLCWNDDWPDTYENGFKPLVKYWQWLNNYYP